MSVLKPEDLPLYDAVVYCTGRCVGCDELFSYNPTKVPTVTEGGQPRPICGPCVERANPIREERGLNPIIVLKGAYEPEPL